MSWPDLTASDLQLAGWTIAVSVVCNVSCALIGCYLVLRRISLLGDAISHGVLPGIVLAVLLTGRITGWPIILGAMAFGVLTALLSQAVHTLARVPEDASMGVVFTALFAVGVILISQIHFSVDLDTGCVLYGNLEYIPLNYFRWLGWRVPVAFPTMGLWLLATLAFVVMLWKELKIASFDPALATAMGLNATVVHYLLMAMVAGVTVTAFEAVGSILVVAMLIVPAACAHLLTDRLGRMLVGAALVAVVSSVLGYVLASQYVLDTNAAGMMAVVAGVQFTLAVLFAPRHGVLARALRNARLALRIASEDILGGLYRAAEARTAGDDAAALRALREVDGAARGVIGRLAWLLLRLQGQVQLTPDGEWLLTDDGRQRAQSVVRAHRLWEAYLGENFDLPLDHLHDPAMRVEHYLGPGLQNELASELRQAGVDPHGKAIPPS